MTELIFRGTGDSQGVPRLYCDCAVCTEARAAGGGMNRRLRSSLQIEEPEIGTIWIDCGPDWRTQMEAARIRDVGVMLISHAHFDHIGGLPEWYDVCRWSGRSGEAYVPVEVIPELRARFPWLEGQLRYIPFAGPIRLGPWTTETWRVNHGRNGYSYAFRFEHEATGRRWAYCSDAIDLTEEELAPLYGLDLLILGTSFYKEPYARETRSVYDVTEAAELTERLRPGRTLLTHLSHDIDIGRSELLPPGMSYAYAGLTVAI